jgi:carboxyl-terminal processing protease
MLRGTTSKVILICLMAVMVGVSGLVLAKSSAKESMLLFDFILRQVRNEYVHPVDLEKLMVGAIRGMMNTLDPHSQYLTKKQYDNLMVSTHGSFGGLGIEIDIRNDWLTVIAPIEGTPAHRIGLRGGDRIVRIEDESTRGITMTEAIQKLRGPEGTDVTITIQREGEPELIDYTITRDDIKIKSVPFAGMMGPRTGYVRVAQFSDDTGEELRAALKELKAQGMEKLVVDLRRNTGGLLSQAIEVTEQFIKPGQTIVSTRGRRSSVDRVYKARARAAGGSYPLVILVDNQSASASEIVAGAVQDLDRGLVVGLPTFGKGTVQSVLSIESGGALKLTTAKYYTPSGRCINKEDRDDEDLSVVFPDDGTADSTRAYYTVGGRLVYGGGGIKPDIRIKPDLMPKMASRLARLGLIFEFAVHYVAGKEEIPEDFSEDPAFMQGFLSFLEEEEFDYTEEDLEEGRDFISIMLRSEVARKVWGDDAAYRISLEGDTQLDQTLDLIRDADSLTDLFAFAAQETMTAE